MKGQYFYFSATQQWLRPIPPKMGDRSDPPPFKNRSCRQISTCNVSTIRASEKSSIKMNRKSYTGFPASYRWSAYVTSKAPFTWYNLLSNWFDNPVNVCMHDSTGCETRCQTGLYTNRFDNGYLNIQPVVKPVWQMAVPFVVQPGLTTGWTNSGCLFNTVERTVAVRSTRLSNRSSNPFDDRFDHRLYREYEHSTGCQTSSTNALTTGWMFVYTIQPVVKLVVQPV